MILVSDIIIDIPYWYWYNIIFSAFLIRRHHI